MTERPRVRAVPRPLAALAVLVLAMLGVVAGPASPASAHASLVSTSPGVNGTVQALPGEVMLTFTEPVNPVAGRIRVIAPDGSRADRDEPRVDGVNLLIPIRPDGPQGTYLVSYRVLSADSHPVGGAFSFALGYFSAEAPPDEGGASQATEDTFISVAFPVARSIGYAGLVLLVGAALVLAALWPRRLERRGPARLMWLGAGLIAVGTVAELLLQAPYVAGGGLFDIGGAEIRDVINSQFGLAHLVRLGLLGVTVVLLRPIAKGLAWGSDRVLLAVLGVLALSTWPVSGHPSASPVPVVTVTADLIHLASMSVWVGGLVMLFLFVIPRATGVELAGIVPVWSRYATYAVSALLLTGVAQALVEVGSVDALFNTTYGWLVVAKVGLFAAVMGVAVVARMLVGPVAAADEAAPRRLRRTVAMETVLAAALIGVASVLVQTTPGWTPPPPRDEAVIGNQSVTMRSNLYELKVDVQPGETGVNFVHLYAYTLDGKPAKVLEWRAKAAPPGGVTEPIDVVVLGITPDHATGQVSLPVPGTWQLSFTLRTTDVDQATVTADIEIRRP